MKSTVLFSSAAKAAVHKFLLSISRLAVAADKCGFPNAFMVSATLAKKLTKLMLQQTHWLNAVAHLLYNCCSLHALRWLAKCAPLEARPFFAAILKHRLADDFQLRRPRKAENSWLPMQFAWQRESTEELQRNSDEVMQFLLDSNTCLVLLPFDDGVEVLRAADNAFEQPAAVINAVDKLMYRLHV